MIKRLSLGNQFVRSMRAVDAACLELAYLLCHKSVTLSPPFVNGAFIERFDDVWFQAGGDLDLPKLVSELLGPSAKC